MRFALWSDRIFALFEPFISDRMIEQHAENIADPVYRYFQKKWIRPHWGEVALRCVRNYSR